MAERRAPWTEVLTLAVFLSLVAGDDRVTTVVNRTVQLPCMFPFIQGPEDLFVVWIKELPDGHESLVHKFMNTKEDLSEQNPLYQGRTQLSKDISQGDLTLTLTDVTHADQGTYQCKGANVKKYETKKVELLIRDHVTKPTIDVLHRADDIILHCWSSTPNVIYKWLDEGGNIVFKQNNYTIRAPKEDRNLTCVVDDHVSEERMSISIPRKREASRSRIPAVAAAVVFGIVISFVFIKCRQTGGDREWKTTAQNPSSLHLSVGQKAKISCKVQNAKEILSHKWKFYSSKFIKMVNSERVKVTQETLIIHSVTPGDAGLYICSLKDKNGTRYRGNGTNLLVTAPPKMTLKESLEKGFLTCVVENFYPKDLEIFWSISPNVHKFIEDVTENQNGTFTKISRLKISEGMNEKDFACHVRHCTLRATMSRPENIESKGCGSITLFLSCQKGIQRIKVQKDGELFIELIMSNNSEVLGNRFILGRQTLTIKEVKPTDCNVYSTEVHQPDGSLHIYHFRVIENSKGTRDAPWPEGRLDEVVDVSPECRLVKLSIPATDNGEKIVWKRDGQTLMTWVVHSADCLADKLVVKPWSVTVHNPEEGCCSYKVDIHLAKNEIISDTFNLHVKKPENNLQDDKSLQFQVERRNVMCELLGDEALDTV